MKPSFYPSPATLLRLTNGSLVIKSRVIFSPLCFFMSWQQHLVPATTLSSSPWFLWLPAISLGLLLPVLLCDWLLGPFSPPPHYSWTNSFMPIALTSPSVLVTSKSLSLAQILPQTCRFNICTWIFHRHLTCPNLKSQTFSPCSDLSPGLTQIETLPLFFLPSFSGLHPISYRIL